MQNQKKLQLEKSGGRCGTDLDRDIDRHRYLDGSRVSVGKGTLKIAATQADRFVGPSAPMQARHVQNKTHYPSWHFSQATGHWDTRHAGFPPSLVPHL